MTRMIRRGACFFVSLLLAANLFEARPAAAAQYRKRVLSPRSDIIAKQRWRHPQESEIWLATTRNPFKKRLLHKFGRSADVLFAKQEDYLVVTDNIGSDLTDVIVYKRKYGLDYECVEGADVEKKVRTFVFKEMGLPADLEVWHSHAAAVTWLSDSWILLVQFTADWTGGYVKQWFCLFDVERLEVSTRLDTLSRQKMELHLRAAEEDSLARVTQENLPTAQTPGKDENVQPASPPSLNTAGFKMLREPP